MPPAQAPEKHSWFVRQDLQEEAQVADEQDSVSLAERLRLLDKYMPWPQQVDASSGTRSGLWYCGL